jgi:Lsr2
MLDPALLTTSETPVGWTSRKEGHLSRRHDPRLANRAWLRQRYLGDQASLAEIAAEVGCALSTVRRALAAAGVVRRPTGRPRKLNDLSRDELVSKVVVHGLDRTARLLHVDPTTVSRNLRRLDVTNEAQAARLTERGSQTQSASPGPTIRAWATANGINVPARGRISSWLREQFEAAHAE